MCNINIRLHTLTFTFTSLASSSNSRKNRKVSECNRDTNNNNNNKDNFINVRLYLRPSGQPTLIAIVGRHKVGPLRARVSSLFEFYVLLSLLIHFSAHWFRERNSEHLIVCAVNLKRTTTSTLLAKCNLSDSFISQCYALIYSRWLVWIYLQYHEQDCTNQSVSQVLELTCAYRITLKSLNTDRNTCTCNRYIEQQAHVGACVYVQPFCYAQRIEYRTRQETS